MVVPWPDRAGSTRPGIACLDLPDSKAVARSRTVNSGSLVVQASKKPSGASRASGSVTAIWPVASRKGRELLSRK